MTLAVLTAVMWGIMGLFVRGLTAQGFSSMEISFFRCFIAGAAYFLYQAVRNPGMLKIDLKGLLICLLYGAAAYSVSFVSYTVAVSPHSSGRGDSSDVYESDLGSYFRSASF